MKSCITKLLVFYMLKIHSVLFRITRLEFQECLLYDNEKIMDTDICNYLCLYICLFVFLWWYVSIAHARHFLFTKLIKYHSIPHPSFSEHDNVINVVCFGRVYPIFTIVVIKHVTFSV